jgi:hypothetical protein
VAVRVGDDDLDFGTAFSTLWENTTTYANADSALTVNADGSTEFSNGFSVNGDVTMDGLSLIERLICTWYSCSRCGNGREVPTFKSITQRMC